MAAILARTARSTAVTSTIRGSRSLLYGRYPRFGALGSLEWSPRSPRAPSLATINAVKSYDYSTKSATPLPSPVGANSPADKTPKRADQRSTVVKMDRDKISRDKMKLKQRRMEQLADARAFGALMRVVSDCYKPLYKTHAKLQGRECKLDNNLPTDCDGDGATKPKTTIMRGRFRETLYNDTVTKSTELHAVKLFVAARRPDLACIVYDHREWLATEIGSTQTQKKRAVTAVTTTVDFASHYIQFYSWVMTAFVQTSDHKTVTTIYENFVRKGETPTASMTSNYATSLLALGDFQAMETLYEHVHAATRPMNRYFYGRMLHLTQVTHNAELMRRIWSEMKTRHIPLHASSFLTAIRSLDGEYFETALPEGSTVDGLETQRPPSRPPTATALAASETVLALFDEMVEIHEMMPRTNSLFPRVLTAAALLGYDDRVTEYITLYKQLFQKPVAAASCLGVATTALLHQHSVEPAWRLVLKAHGMAHAQDQQPVASDSPWAVTASLSQISDYLCERHDTTLIVAFLEALQLQNASNMLNRLQPGRLITTLVLDTATVSDEELETLMDKFEPTFHVRSKLLSLKAFTTTCGAAGRWAMLRDALMARDRQRIPCIPGWLAVELSDLAVQDRSDRSRMELVVELLDMVDMASLESTERMAIGCHAIRALSALGGRRDVDAADKQQYRDEISRIHEQLLIPEDNVGGVESLPQDVRDIVARRGAALDANNGSLVMRWLSKFMR